jgi:HlyD family secretion protein
MRGLDRTEVTSGLKEGDQVLANPDASLENGTRVRLKP